MFYVNKQETRGIPVSVCVHVCACIETMQIIYYGLVVLLHTSVQMSITKGLPLNVCFLWKLISVTIFRHCAPSCISLASTISSYVKVLSFICD